MVARGLLILHSSLQSTEQASRKTLNLEVDNTNGLFRTIGCLGRENSSSDKATESRILILDLANLQVIKSSNSYNVRQSENFQGLHFIFFESRVV